MTQSTENQPKQHRSIGYRARREILLRLLPMHSFKLTPAAIEAGYTKSYAERDLPNVLKKDKWFSEKLERVKEQCVGIAEDKMKAADAQLYAIMDDTNLSVREKLKALELYYRRNGALTDKQITETSDRKQELTKSQRSEAKKLAILRFKTDKAG